MAVQALPTDRALLSSLRRAVPPELEALLLKLLRKQLADRIGYADDVALDLATPVSRSVSCCAATAR